VSTDPAGTKIKAASDGTATCVACGESTILGGGASRLMLEGGVCGATSRYDCA
jgi:hypothetical protein